MRTGSAEGLRASDARWPASLVCDRLRDVTLNITVATRRCIYQSADFRLLDLTTGETSDFETQKIVLVNTFAWTATVCFAGVGRTRNVDVAEWLADLVASIDWKDPFERLLVLCLTYD